MKKIPVPAFLRKFDTWLLENYPLLWTVKLHYVAAVAFLALIPVTLLVLARPVSPTNIPSVAGWFITMTIPMVLIYAGFALFQIIFTGRRQFGRESFRADYTRQLLAFAAGAILLSVPWATSSLLVTKTNQAIPKSEVISDLNDLNKGVKFFYGFGNSHNLTDSDFPLRKVEYEYEVYQVYELDETEVLSGAQLMDLDNVNDSYEKLKADLDAFFAAYEKWGGEMKDYDSDEIIRNYRSGKTNLNFFSVWNHGELYGNLYDWGDIYRWDFGLFERDAMAIALFVLFIITVLILILQSISLKHFLVAVVAGFLLIPVTVLMMEAYRMGVGYGGSDEVGLSLMWMYFIGAGAVTFGSLSAKRFSGFRTVVATLFNASLPFVPVVAAISLEEFDILSLGYMSDSDVISLLWMGVAFYLVVGIPLMTRVYRKLHSLPRG